MSVCHYDKERDTVVQWCSYCEKEVEFYHRGLNPEAENFETRCEECDGVI